MPANNKRQQAAQPPPASPSPKATAKYTNKDGSKFITVPKSSAPTPPAQPSPTTTTSSSKGPSQMYPPSDTNGPAPTVNRKKQKRRAKAAAKAAAEQQAAATSNGLPSPADSVAPPPPPAPSSKPSRYQHTPVATGQGPPLDERNADYWDDETESEDEQHLASYHQHLGQAGPNGSPVKSKKSKKKKKGLGTDLQTGPPHISGISREKIWNTSSHEERERIKQFWLGLGEAERKSLVKVEKDAVLRKMKEQQKHTCSCSVCGRKRTAIEEELEGLYDAYYDELESFANQPHPDGPPMLGNPKRFGPLTGLHPPRSMPGSYPTHQPSRGRIMEHGLDDDEDVDHDGEDQSYSDEEDDLDEDDDEEEPEEIPRDYASDFFNFGNSLTVQGGILTVADDLLKNDGKKFIEMMEQLAERRMAREEDAKDHYAGGYGHSVNGAALPGSHNHPPPDDGEYEDEEDEDYEDDSQEDAYDEEDEEEDTMTDEQRMEEGRRMFQIFAARMFEQRVLTAYREKVAAERQQKLIEELEDETRLEAQRKAKKAKEAQKRKDKAAQKKQQQAEDKARKEAEKAAEEAAHLAEQTRKAEEARAKAEERKKKKEAQKKAEEEERLKKESERLRRAQEQKERQAEQERKLREVKDREKKLKEEQRQKEKEARELKERETRERREKHEKDKREKEARAAQAKAERDAKEKAKQEEKAAHKVAILAAPIPAPPPKKQQQHPVSIPALPQHPAANHASPQIPVATPALPKAPTPIKPRSSSRQEVTRSVSQTSHTGSGPSGNPSPGGSTPAHASPGPIGPPSKTSSAGPPGSIPGTQPTSPLHASFKGPPGFGPAAGQPPFGMAPPMGMQYPPGIPPIGPGFGRAHEPMFPMNGGFRPGPGMPLPPPGLGAPMGRGFPPPHAPPGFPGLPGDHITDLNHGFPMSSAIPIGQPRTHSRQASGNFEATSNDIEGSGTQALPIGRPAPIGRPGSVVHGHRSGDSGLNAEIDDINSHLGSSALLDDSDEPIGEMHSQRRGTAAPGSRPQFSAAPPFMDPVFGSPLSRGWAAPNPFGPPPGFSGNAGWGPSSAFGPPSTTMRPAQPRSVVVRQMLCQASKDLGPNAADNDGYIDLGAIKAHVDVLNLNPNDPILEKDILDICDTEGNPHNGGGSFEIRRDSSGKISIRFDATGGAGQAHFGKAPGAPGEIGSPIVAPGTIGGFGTRT